MDTSLDKLLDRFYIHSASDGCEDIVLGHWTEDNDPCPEKWEHRIDGNNLPQLVRLAEEHSKICGAKMTKQQFADWYDTLAPGDKIRVMHLVIAENINTELDDEDPAIKASRERIHSKFYGEKS